MHSHGRNDGPVMPIDCHTFFFCGAEGDLLRPSARKPLTPKVTLTSAVTLKYIHAPSGDQPAEVHAPCGPMDLAAARPTREISRQGRQSFASFISTTRADWRSGDA